VRLKHVSIWLVAVGCLTTVVEGQKSFWGSPQAYLGQTRPSDTPQIFAPDLLTEPGTIAMDHIAFSRDGREIYYLQSDRWGSLAHVKIKTFLYDGHRWTGPTVLTEHLFAVTMAPDDRELYFEDDDPKHVWRSERTKADWTTPVVAYEEPFGMYGFTPTKSAPIIVATRIACRMPSPTCVPERVAFHGDERVTRGFPLGVLPARPDAAPGGSIAEEDLRGELVGMRRAGRGNDSRRALSAVRQ